MFNSIGILLDQIHQNKNRKTFFSSVNTINTSKRRKQCHLNVQNLLPHTIYYFVIFINQDLDLYFRHQN